MAGVGVRELRLVEVANRGLARTWAHRHLSGPPLDPASLVTKAERSEKRQIEPGHWQEALDVVTQDLQETAALNPLGRVMAHGQLVNILRQRIRAERLWRSRPEIVARPIERPVIVLGQMRSGTTLTHRLLACDRRFSFTRTHETLSPMARSRAGAQAHAMLLRATLNAINPGLSSVHPTSASAPEEEFGLHAFSLHGAMFEAQWNIPGYARWSEARDLSPVYREFHQLLQTLRWRRGDSESAIQLLKAPQFMQDLPALLDEFPGARIVMLVRNPAEVMASTASLVWHQQRIQSNEADPKRIGAEWRRKTLLRADRAAAALRHLTPEQLVTVDYGDLKADWSAQVARIYDFLGLPLPSSLLARMSRQAVGSKHLGHVYSGEQFGLAQ